MQKLYTNACEVIGISTLRGNCRNAVRSLRVRRSHGNYIPRLSGEDSHSNNGWFREHRLTTRHVLRTWVQLTLDEREGRAFSGHVSATSSRFLPHDIG